MFPYILIFSILPVMVMAMGLAWKIWPPSMDHFFHGYRTPYAMMSKEVWEFTQRFSGTALLSTGIIMAVGSLAVLFVFRGSDPVTLRYVHSRLRIAQIVAVMVPIVLTEIAMRKHFDGKGNPR